MNSASSTERPAAGKDAGMQPWHFFLLLAMVGATVAVMRARDTQPASLLLISAAVIASGVVGIACYAALAGFFGSRQDASAPLSAGTRQALESEKALVLRSIKELEFDKAMRKIDDDDFAEIDGRLRERALDLMEQLDRQVDAAAEPEPVTAPTQAVCPSCQAKNDGDAVFCKRCGSRLS